MRGSIARTFVMIVLTMPAWHCALAVNAMAMQATPQGHALALGSFPADKSDDVMPPRVAAAGTVRQCFVTSIHDGDSMRVRCPGFKDTLRVRLDQIDAPELEQAHGIKARDLLRSMCSKGSKAVLHDLGADDYNRRLGRIFCNDVDVNAAMVEAGAAWVYDYHVTDKTLYALQDRARSQRQGLWAGPGTPVAPWDFRYSQRRQGVR